MSLFCKKPIATDSEVDMDTKREWAEVVMEIVKAIEGVPAKSWLLGAPIHHDTPLKNGLRVHISLYPNAAGPVTGVIRASDNSPSLPEGLLRMTANTLYYSHLIRTPPVNGSWLSFVYIRPTN